LQQQLTRSGIYSAIASTVSWTNMDKTATKAATTAFIGIGISFFLTIYLFYVFLSLFFFFFSFILTYNRYDCKRAQKDI